MNDPSCHYTCFTCTGPGYNECETCNSEKNREISGTECTCMIGYFDFGELKC